MVCVRFRRWVKQKKKQASKSCNEGGQLVLLQLEKEKKKKRNKQMSTIASEVNLKNLRKSRNTDSIFNIWNWLITVDEHIEWTCHKPIQHQFYILTVFKIPSPFQPEFPIHFNPNFFQLSNWYTSGWGKLCSSCLHVLFCVNISALTIISDIQNSKAWLFLVYFVGLIPSSTKAVSTGCPLQYFVFWCSSDLSFYIHEPVDTSFSDQQILHPASYWFFIPHPTFTFFSLQQYI